MFWDKLKAPYMILAPMEAVTDVPFRQVVAKAGAPEVFFTEFTNVSSYANEAGRANAMERLVFAPGESGEVGVVNADGVAMHPLVAQIWGKNPEHFKEAVRGCVSLGYKAIDINMGCPEKNVVKNGGGAGMIRTPELAVEVIRAAKEAAGGGADISVKTRLGFSKVEEWRDWLRLVLEQDLAALTVHLRTRKEMSNVDAHFELLPEIVALRNEVAPKTRLHINGDIVDRKHGERLMREHGFEGAMIGRGVFVNPFCFVKRQPTRVDLMKLLCLHVSLWPNPDYIEPLKRFFKVYIRDFDGASMMREKLMATQSLAEVREALESEGVKYEV
ncbi:tRNA-dihydrouridine synthase [Candidatus Saccharibacteria bacterium]|nr:tRNA-dihydrouridine synthase [Candidatus Saccharibacteria bacterium]